MLLIGADDSYRMESRAIGVISFFVFKTALSGSCTMSAQVGREFFVKGDMAAAVRKERVVNIAVDELRQGDLVIIQTGDIIPADLKLLESSDLEVDEFDLTGEIVPVRKAVQQEGDILLLQGSNVLQGHGKGVVIAAGDATEYGRILRQPSQRDKFEEIPFGKNTSVALLLLLVSALLVRLTPGRDYGLVFITYGILTLLLLLLQNGEWLKFILMRYHRKRLLKRGIYLRHAGVLDEIGKIDLFCFDKTGVLTSRDIKVKDVFLGGEDTSVGSGIAGGQETGHLILVGCVLCHDITYHETVTYTNSLDRALISYAEDNGTTIEQSLCRYHRIYQKPFRSEERYMACGFKDSKSGKPIHFAKGDPDVLLKMCCRYVTSTGEKKPVDFSFMSSVQTRLAAMSDDGSVVIALAYDESAISTHPANYTFLCLFQLENPLKAETQKVFHYLGKKGIRNVILTGDRKATALRVGAETCLEQAAKICLNGRSIEKMPLSEVARITEYVSLFAELLPSQKGVIVRLFQQKRHRVAMVGDGTNDVIALKAADVGISFVERSSPLAKRAAKVLVADLTDILALMEAACRVRRQAGWMSVAITLVFLAILFGGDLLIP
jgi:Ca2+-transporting ATPase